MEEGWKEDGGLGACPHDEILERCPLERRKTFLPAVLLYLLGALHGHTPHYLRPCKQEKR